MAIKQEFRVLLEKKMDRKDFLKHVGIGLVAITGVSAIARTLVPTPSKKVGQVSQPTVRNDSYGGSAYGGVKTS